MRNSKRNRIVANIAFVLLLLQIAVIIIPWFVDAIMPDLHLHSLLSGKGVRWLIGRSTNHILTPVLSCLLMLSIAWGVFYKSNLFRDLTDIFVSRKHWRNLRYKQRFALQITTTALLLCLIVVAFITCLPQAALLSATGTLLKGSFPRSIIPLISIVTIIVSAVYGVFVDKLTSFEKICLSMIFGLRQATPYILLYIISAELFASFVFVFDL